jgi:NAD(P)-dependent dehydrogenase (short-subunit alcohol dehydrogenase family)
MGGNGERLKSEDLSVMTKSFMDRAFRLDGRHALISGAGRGIGQACALAMASAGATVWVLARSADQVEETCAAIRAEGGTSHALIGDVTKAADVERVFATIARLDILVNNAGTNIPEPFVAVSEAHLDRVLNLNVRSAFLVAQAAVRKMMTDPERKTKGGVVINMSSQMGHIGSPNRTVYCMTKHAIEGLTKAMAVELAPANIRVVSVAPTFVDTPMTAPMFERPGFREFVLNRIPLGRIGTMDEIAAAVLYLASPGAALVTGTSLVVDGGWTAQ